MDLGLKFRGSADFLFVRAALLGFRRRDQRGDFFQKPHVRSNPGFHRGSYAQRFMDAADEVKRENDSRVVLARDMTELANWMAGSSRAA